MSRSLVVARVGRKSLHRCWVDPGKPRDWDLHLCPFEEIGPLGEGEWVVGDVIPGPKWTGLRQYLNAWQGWRDYDQIWLPDDDIFASQDAIGAMFEAGRALDFQLYAPALHEASHYAHHIAMRNQRFFARRVGFVEIMIPCFSRDALDALLSTLDLSTTGWGWGLDSAWPKILDYQGLGIIDGVTVLHTRAVGQFRDADLSRRVLAESDNILGRFDCGQRMVNFAGIGPDLQDMALSPEQLLRELARGWDYLFDGNPMLLRWIVEQQQCLLDAAPYPVAGLPTSPR